MGFNVQIGIDLGNGYTKYDGKMFKTRTRTGRLLKIGNVRDNVHSINYNGTDFIVGEGEMLTGEDKYDNLRYKLCLLTAIADSSKRLKNIKAKISIGLPLLDFDRLKTIVSEKILSWGEESITVDGKDYTIEIVEVIPFIEGALPILTEDASNMLTIDIGSGTINVIEWDNMSPVDYDTIPKSYYKMYSSVATHLNNMKGGGFTVEDVEKFMLGGKIETTVNQKKVDVSDAYVILEDFVSGSASLIKQRFKTGQVEKIAILGGGAESSAKYWLKHFPEAQVVRNSQLINSEIFDLVSKM